MDSEKEQLLAKILKTAGYSMTRPRKLVFHALLSQEPMPMHRLQNLVGATIDRASLYRIIRVFEETGIVQRVNIGWKYKLELTDVFNDHHHHVSCLGCGKIIAVKETPEIERFVQNIAKQHGITAKRHQFEIQGYCRNCTQPK